MEYVVWMVIIGVQNRILGIGSGCCVVWCNSVTFLIGESNCIYGNLLL